VKNSPKLAPNPNSHGSSSYCQIEPIKKCKNANEPIKLHNK